MLLAVVSVLGLSFPSILAGPIPSNLQSSVPIPWSPGMTLVPSLSGSMDLQTLKGELVKRQDDIFKKALMAHWAFHCPIGGTDTRIMKWKGEAEVRHNRVTVTNIWNIDSWEDLQIVDRNFHAFFIHGYCVQRGRLACIYKLRGKTTGWVDNYGIHMNMIIHSTDGDENPKVEEECVDTGGAHEGTHFTCPAIVEMSSSRCSILQANAEYIPVPPGSGGSDGH